MKNSDELARDVLERIHAYKERQTQRRRTAGRVAVAVGCACLTVLTCLWSGVSLPQVTPESSNPVSQTPDEPVHISMMQAVYLADGDVHTKDLTETGEIPLWYRLQVEDVRKGDPETDEDYGAEYQTLLEESQLWVEQYAGKEAHASVTRFENVVISAYSCGYVRVAVTRPEQVENIRVSCATGIGTAEMSLWADSLTGQAVPYVLETKEGAFTLEKTVNDSGRCWLYGQSVTLMGDTYRALYSDAENGRGDFFLRWKPHSALNEALNKYPDTPLSSFSDEMTVTVNYTDGSADIYTLAVQFTDDGIVTINFVGSTTEK